jgi:predicted methyltransferase
MLRTARCAYRALAVLVVFFAVTSCTTTPTVDTSAADTAAAIERILAADHRSAANRARDPYRHPKETLLFFGIRPHMSVVEIWPGAGWYTEILAPLLRERGRLYVAHLDPAAGERNRLTVEEFRSKLAGRPDLYDRVTVTALGTPAPSVRSEIAPAGTVDMVLTFRNMHNWMTFGWPREAFEAMYAALRPGGVLGIVEHRGNPARPQDPKALSGYVDERYAIEMIESVGFKLQERSEINSNPRDTKDYEAGVWTLPPELARGSRDRSRYEAIGESDRFTLRFVKPAT